MKVIVTGATGFMGRNLVEGLKQDGMEVIATGRNREVGAELEKSGVDFRPADIEDQKGLIKALSPTDCLVHSAGKSGHGDEYNEYHGPNVVGTRNVVEACRRHGIRKIIFISSPSIYFTRKDRYDISEDEPLPKKQKNPYSLTKLISERELLALAPEGFRTIILRPRGVYGPHDNTIVPIILKLAEKDAIPLINGGNALVDVTYVENYVDAVKKGLRAKDSAWNHAYNISNGDPITMREWFAEVLKIFDVPFRPKSIPIPAAKVMAGLMEAASFLPFGPKKPAMTRFTVGYMARSMTLSLKKAKDMLGYAPRIGTQEGFERYARWYRERGG